MSATAFQRMRREAGKKIQSQDEAKPQNEVKPEGEIQPDLNDLSYKELVSLAKEKGITCGKKKEDLLNALAK